MSYKLSFLNLPSIWLLKYIAIRFLSAINQVRSLPGHSQLSHINRISVLRNFPKVLHPNRFPHFQGQEKKISKSTSSSESIASECVHNIQAPGTYLLFEFLTLL